MTSFWGDACRIDNSIAKGLNLLLSDVVSRGACTQPAQLHGAAKSLRGMLEIWQMLEAASSCLIAACCNEQAGHVVTPCQSLQVIGRMRGPRKHHCGGTLTA